MNPRLQITSVEDPAGEIRASSRAERVTQQARDRGIFLYVAVLYLLLKNLES